MSSDDETVEPTQAAGHKDPELTDRTHFSNEDEDIVDRLEQAEGLSSSSPAPVESKQDLEQQAENHDRQKPSFGVWIDIFKYVYSSLLLAFCLVVVMCAIFTKQTKATDAYNMPPVAAFSVFWLMIMWLAVLEGGQGCIVGLQSVDTALYAQSHPRTLQCMEIVQKDDNVERFIIGRQFLVVLVVFVTNLMASAIPDADVVGLHEDVSKVFLDSGAALILVAIILGQLTSQISATTCMIDFINNRVMLFTIYAALAIEASGILHCTYLVQMIFSYFAKTTSDPNHQSSERSMFQKTLFWSKVCLSVVLLVFALHTTLLALFEGQTAMWEGVPGAVSVLLFFALMGLVGLMEGIQIALFAVLRMSEEELSSNRSAFSCCKLAFEGRNFEAFLIGRQIAVTMCMFIIARISTIEVDIDDPDSDNIFSVKDGTQEFLNTGLLGAIITTIFASLAWRIIASSFPLAFMSNPLIYGIIWFCLILEKSGLCSAAWLLATVQKYILCYKADEIYLCTLEKMSDVENPSSMDEVAVHLSKPTTGPVLG